MESTWEQLLILKFTNVITIVKCNVTCMNIGFVFFFVNRNLDPVRPLTFLKHINLPFCCNFAV